MAAPMALATSACSGVMILQACRREKHVPSFFVVTGATQAVRLGCAGRKARYCVAAHAACVAMLGGPACRIPQATKALLWRIQSTLSLRGRLAVTHAHTHPPAHTRQGVTTQAGTSPHHHQRHSSAGGFGSIHRRRKLLLHHLQGGNSKQRSAAAAAAPAVAQQHPCAGREEPTMPQPCCTGAHTMQYTPMHQPLSKAGRACF